MVCSDENGAADRLAIRRRGFQRTPESPEGKLRPPECCIMSSMNPRSPTEHRSGPLVRRVARAVAIGIGVCAALSVTAIAWLLRDQTPYFASRRSDLGAATAD